MPKLKPRAPKAYKNSEFLGSPDARAIRILAEFLEPLSRLRRYGVKNTIVFFGSARLKPRKEAEANRLAWEKRVASVGKPSAALRRRLEEATIGVEMSRYYEEAVELSRMLTTWSMKLKEPNRFLVCSGGGPGIMEAANKGAYLAGGKSIGLNISLPFEQAPNGYISDEFNFEFHYFFMRKFWFVYPAKALVLFPGGFGTLDEMMEVLTLLQTHKIKKHMTVVLYGKEYWSRVLNFDMMVHYGVISRKDLKLFTYKDSPAEAYDYLVQELRRNYSHDTESI